MKRAKISSLSVQTRFHLVKLVGASAAPSRTWRLWRGFALGIRVGATELCSLKLGDAISLGEIGWRFHRAVQNVAALAGFCTWTPHWCYRIALAEIVVLHLEYVLVLLGNVLLNPA